jgi:hypothetical protein
MAKATQTEPMALEALTGLLGESRVLHGSAKSPGVFKGASAGDKTAAQFALEKGWLEKTGQTLGKGKSAKDLYRITPAGLQAVLARADPTSVLQKLQESLGSVEKTLAEALRPLESLSQLKSAVAQALERIKPIDLDAVTRKLAETRQPSAPAANLPDSRPTTNAWGEEVVRLAAEQKQRHAFQRLTLPQLYERLRATHPNLTLGEFHDGLRRLQDEKRIRLGPYTQALATLDDPRNALFLDREVKYYVELP